MQHLGSVCFLPYVHTTISMMDLVFALSIYLYLYEEKFYNIEDWKKFVVAEL